MTYLETRAYTISTLSPIHIQAGKLEYGEGFIRVGENVYVVDAPKLQTEIFKFGGLETVNQYTQVFSKPNPDIAKFLDKIRYNYKSNIRKISKGIVRLPRGNRFIQSGFGKHFVPGSSIKGAIKTAVLYHLMKNILTDHPDILDTFVDKKITAYLNDPSNDQKQRFAAELLENTFQSRHPQEHFPNDQRTDEDPNGPFTDIFRAIKVKDAIIEKLSEVQFENILFTTLNGANQIAQKRVGRNFECFHGETTIEITIDHEILESFKRAGVTPPFSGVPSLIKLCQDFAQRQWDAAQTFLGKYPGAGGLDLSEVDKFYTKNKNPATLRVGWGTGMLGTTISLLLDEPIRVDLRNEVISGGHHKRPKPAPKSRRFVLENGQPIYPLGWIELQEK